MGQKLGQVAVRLDGMKTKIKEFITGLYQKVQKPALFNGYTRTYEPYQTDGGRAATQPPENQMVQARYQEILAGARASWAQLMDLTYTQDLGNTNAKADIIVDGATIVKDVPVTTLMFLIKQWTDVLTFLQALPTPDPAVDWEWDATQGLLRSKEQQIVQKTAKVMKTLVKFAPTDKHPGQADVYTADEPVGDYIKRVFSGAVPADKKAAMVEAATRIVEALKVARAVANSTTVIEDAKIAGKLFDQVFMSLAA